MTKSTYEELKKRVKELEKENTRLEKLEMFQLESEEKYKELTDMLLQTVFKIDEKCNLLFISRQACDILGYIKDDFDKGINLIEMLVPYDRDRAKENIRKILSGKKISDNEYKIQGKDGSILPVTISSSQIIYKNKFIGLRGIVMDITERKKIEEKVMCARDDYFTITNLPGDIIVKVDKEGKLTFVNNEACQFWNKSREELIGSAFVDYLHPDDRGETITYVEKVKSKKIIKGLINRQKTPDGWRIVEWNGAAIFDDEGKYEGFQATCRDITERMKMEESLTKSERIKRILLENSPDIILEIDLEDRITYINHTAEWYKKEDVIGVNARTFIPQKFQEEYDKAFNNVFNNGIADNFEFTDAYSRSYFARCIPIKGENQVVVSAVIIAIDITERIITEKALMRSEEKYRVLFENLQDLIYRADTDGSIILISPSCEKIFGYASEEVIGMNLANDFYVHPEKRKEFLTVLKDKGYVEDFEAEMKKKDGSTIWVSTNAHYYTDKEGNVLGVEGTTRDFTKRKKVEDALRVSEQRFRELVDLLPQTVCEIDLAGNFTFKNLHGFESYGYTQKDIDKGLNALQLFIPEERDRINENIQRILSGEKLGGNEYTALRKDGSRFPVIMYCSPIIYKNKSVGLRGIVVDITERKRSEKSLNEYRKQIQQSERLAATGRLAASIAHEINNPLQAISANLGFLVQVLPDNFKENNSLEQIKISINRIKNTVKQLLDIHHSKIETEQKVNVNEVIESTLNLLKNQLMIDKIKVNRKLSTNIPLTRGIAQELLQVFMNLILNAQGAMKGGGVLNINTNVKDSKLQIVFRDNGCGISEGDIDYIFDPFYTTKSKMLGTGLGLSISKGIVQSFGGEINVKSQIGKGTTFLITFPIS